MQLLYFGEPYYIMVGYFYTKRNFDIFYIFQVVLDQGLVWRWIFLEHWIDIDTLDIESSLGIEFMHKRIIYFEDHQTILFILTLQFMTITIIL